jgi:hypothetical protein
MDERIRTRAIWNLIGVCSPDVTGMLIAPGLESMRFYR